LATNREGKHWTQEEIEKLEDMVGIYSFEEIGEKLGRTALGVEKKLVKLGFCDTKINAGYLSLHEVSQALNVNGSVIKGWKKKYDFPLFNKSLRYTGLKNKSHYVKPDSFWKWAFKNKDVINLTRYELGSIIPEPAWLKEAIKEQSASIPKNTRVLWTPEEETRLWYSRYQLKMTIAELAIEFGRSKNSVQRKLENLVKQKMKA